MGKLSSEDKSLLKRFISEHRMVPVAVDLAKSVFQVCYYDPSVKQLKNFQLSRDRFIDFVANEKIDGKPMYFGIEACGACNFWANFMKSSGNKCRILQASGIKAYSSLNKTDKIDAFHIFRSLLGNTKTAAAKDPHPAMVSNLNTFRLLLAKIQVQICNAARAMLYERGLAVPEGKAALCNLLSAHVDDSKEKKVPELSLLLTFCQAANIMLNASAQAMTVINAELKRFTESDQLCRNLLSIPGIGTVCASGLYPALYRCDDFKDSRHFASYAGVAPVMSGTGGSAKIVGVSKGPISIKRPLHMAALVRFSRLSKDPESSVAKALAKGKCPATVISAISNRLARVAWAIAKSGKPYDATKCSLLE